MANGVAKAKAVDILYTANIATNLVCYEFPYFFDFSHLLTREWLQNMFQY